MVRSTGDTVKLMLWDTAGQEMFSKLTRSYYKGTPRSAWTLSKRPESCDVVLWCSVVPSCQVMSCYAVFCQAMSCHVMPCRVMPCCGVSCRCVMLCRVMSCYVVLCLSMTCNDMSCQAVSLATRHPPIRVIMSRVLACSLLMWCECLALV